MTEKEISGQKKLKSALGQYELSFEEKYPPAQIEIKYSQKYTKKINKLIGKKYERPVFFYTVAKRVAVIFFAIIISFSVSMTVSAIREPIVEFFTNIYEKFIEIFYYEDDISEAPTEIKTVYTLGHIPNGYKLESIVFDDIRAITTLSNGESQIVFSQYLLNGKTALDNETSNFEYVYLNDLKIAVTEKNGIKTLYWNTDEYAFKLIFNIEFSNQEYIAMINSIIKYEK